MDLAARPVAEAPVKPRLRGVSHEIMFYAGLLGAALLVAWAPAGRATVASAIYAACFVFLFGASALYHRPTWQPAQRALLKRVDHSAIFFLIAGTYTPIALLGVPPETGVTLLWVVWIGAGLGVVQSIAWPTAPKPLVAALAVGLGWAVVMEWPAVHAGLGDLGAGLVIGGGALYTVGAVVYATRRPNPAPQVFGYHEVFHLFVIAAAVCHAAVVVRLVAG